MEKFLEENDVIAVNMGGAEIIGEFVSTYKDENSKDFLILRNPVLIITQTVKGGIAHQMMELSERGNFSSEMLVPWDSVTYIRKVSRLGDLFKAYSGAISGLSLVAPSGIPNMSKLHIAG